jgi:hypothetical protein
MFSNEKAGKTQVYCSRQFYLRFLCRCIPRLNGSVPCVGRNKVSLPIERRAPVCERGSFRASDFLNRIRQQAGGRCR